MCWDQWYPEAARLMALAGADVLLYPTAIGWDPDDAQDEKERQRDAWITVQRGHASPTVCRCWPATASVSKRRPTAVAASSSGARASSPVRRAKSSPRPASTRRELLIADVDLARSESVRRIWPFLRDRRIDAYDDLLKRYRD